MKIVGTERAGAPSGHGLLELQRSAGNQAVVQLLRQTDGASSTGVSVQRWNPFKRKKKSGSLDDLSNMTVSGPKAGRPMGQPAPKRAQILPMFEFEKDPRRRQIFANWAQQQQRVEQIGQASKKAQFDNTKLTEQVLYIDYVLSPFQSLKPPTYEEAVRIVATVRNCADPEVQRVVAESEDKYRPFGLISKLEDAVESEAKYRQQNGGIKMLAGISGVIHYMGNDLYTMFDGTPSYQEALGLPERPPVPSREGRGKLSGVDGGVDSAPVEIGSPGLGAPKGRVGELSKQLGGVIGAVRPGGNAPKPGAHSGPVLGPPSGSSGGVAKERIVLEERQDPRATEKKILDAIAAGQPVSPELLARLTEKVGKSQTTSRGREVTAVTEAEYFDMAAKLSPEDRQKLKIAANDYAGTSTEINKLARGQKLLSDPSTIQHQLNNLDAVFTMLDQKGLTDKRRIVYRLSTYYAGQAIPYGDTVKVGDVVGDKAYMSTSENRQLLQEGAVKRKPGVRFVKFTIMATGGANISGGGPYTNEMGKRGEKELGLKGPSTVGQAEILFRRASLFRIEDIVQAGKDVHVRATRVEGAELGGQTPKNAFTGEALSLT